MQILSYDITGWQRQEWYHTKGTREKFTCESPHDGLIYYFKESLSKPASGTRPGYSYPSEFWSEIIASKVGALLGFDLLDYNLAYFDKGIGCICRDMLKPRQNLVEGFQYLTVTESKFLPDEDYTSRKLYDFQLIEKSFNIFSLERFIHNLIDVIFFDAIIGNSDRHQENWGFIYHVENAHRHLINKQNVHEQQEKELIKQIIQSPFQETSSNLPSNSKNFFSKAKALLIKLANKDIDNSKQRSVDELFLEVQKHAASAPVITDDSVKFAPIYDSGSSLGREVSEEKIALIIKDKNKLEAYIRKGKSEIHWMNEKLNHVELLLCLCESYPDAMRVRLNQVQNAYNGILIKELIASSNLIIPDREVFSQYKLSKNRQTFISNIIEARISLISRTLSLLI